MRQDVTTYIRQCDTCAKAKHSCHKLYGLLQSAPTPEQPWSIVTLDFITKLPLSKEPLIGIVYDSILVIVDSLTKFVYLKPYKEASTIEDLVYIFNKVVITRHSILDKLVSD